MSETVGDFLVKRLSEWGVKRIFGYPGDGITGIMGALHRAGNDPELIQVRHEEMASFMACAHAKFTGEVGVCLATSGPGAIHLLNGLYDAKMDHRPVVAIVGQQALASLGGDYQQEVDLVSLYKDVANEYVHVLADPTQARHLLDRLELLNVVGHHQAGNRSLGLRDAERPVEQVPRLRGVGEHLHVLVRYVLVQRDEVHLLLVVAA